MILVVGDFMVDEYVFGVVERISPEAPIPVCEFHHREFRPGGAGNVANNIRSLRNHCVLVGVVGSEGVPFDFHGENYLFADPDRPTTRKTRYMHLSHHLLRVDHESTYMISGEVEKNINQFIDLAISTANVLVISDYGKGVVTEKVAKSAIKEANKYGAKVIVDSKRKDMSCFEGAYLATPNDNEFHACTTGFDGIQNVLHTMGSGGMKLYEMGKEPVQIDSCAKEIIDVTGAGDTVVAAIASYIDDCHPNTVDLLEACHFANNAAGVAVSKVGTATVVVDRYGNPK